MGCGATKIDVPLSNDHVADPTEIQQKTNEKHFRDAENLNTTPAVDVMKQAELNALKPSEPDPPPPSLLPPPILGPEILPQNDEIIELVLPSSPMAPTTPLRSPPLPSISTPTIGESQTSPADPTAKEDVEKASPKAFLAPQNERRLETKPSKAELVLNSKRGGGGDVKGGGKFQKVEKIGAPVLPKKSVAPARPWTPTKRPPKKPIVSSKSPPKSVLPKKEKEKETTAVAVAGKPKIPKTKPKTENENENENENSQDCCPPPPVETTGAASSVDHSDSEVKPEPPKRVFRPKPNLWKKPVVERKLPPNHPSNVPTAANFGKLKINKPKIKQKSVAVQTETESAVSETKEKLFVKRSVIPKRKKIALRLPISLMKRADDSSTAHYTLLPNSWHRDLLEHSLKMASSAYGRTVPLARKTI